MKNIILTITFLVTITGLTYSQQVNGTIVSDSGNLKVVKIWGTHYQRGFAYGFLCGHDIMSVWNNYVFPTYGIYLNLAKQIVGNENYFSIDNRYRVEAGAILDGIGAAGFDTTGLSYLDLFVVNFLNDLQGFMPKKLPSQNCSSLLDWGDATLGTDLNGKSVICHHLDADQPDTAIINNQVLVIHFPSEPDEQPWLLTGTAGQMTAAQTVNNSGLCAFLNSVEGFSAQINMHYEPITLAIRKAIETADYNNDGKNNTDDMRAALSSNVNGYANGFIVCAVAPSTEITDSLTAGIIELASQQPYVTYRNADFADSITGENIYAANSMIKRNNAYDFCSRYTAVKNEINLNYNGQGIGSQDNWDIMKNFSTQSTNLQMIQVIPENRIFKISIRDAAHLAYQKTPMTLDMNILFTPVGIDETNQTENFNILMYPNPVKEQIQLELSGNHDHISYEISDLTGQIIQKSVIVNKTNIDVSGFPQGLYLIKVISDKGVTVKNFIKI
ncbi:MAG TPA: T9SS type A sorting domain-containing protein [Bacteroidales bacterium]|nr:T9SS type A sorting domain-containing protein [Bacteroidales bacterium]